MLLMIMKELEKGTTIEGLKRFIKIVVEIFGTVYLRWPNAINVSILLVEIEVSITCTVSGKFFQLDGKVCI